MPVVQLPHLRPGNAAEAWKLLWRVPECDHLNAENERLRRRYSLAVERLFATGYQLDDIEYRELKNDVDEARAQWEIAQPRG